MENSICPHQVHHLNRRDGVLSCPRLDLGDSVNLGTLSRHVSISDLTLENDTKYDIRRSWFSLELLYKTTDIVLVICGVIFIGSSIASIVLWMYGFSWGKILWLFLEK